MMHVIQLDRSNIEAVYMIGEPIHSVLPIHFVFCSANGRD